MVAGPSHWADTYPQCGGRRQSPINIELGKTEHKDLGDLALKGYNTSSGHGFKLLNNGHTGIILYYIILYYIILYYKI